MPSLARAAELWRSLELRAQIALVASAIAVLATGYFLFSLASKPSYSVVASGLTATEGGDVANSLESAGITYELARRRRRPSPSQSSDVTQARVQLAAGQPAERRPRRLRALRLQVARRDRLRAEGQVPARARRRDRAHDRVGRRRPLGAGAARAARSSRCSSTTARSASAAVLLQSGGMLDGAAGRRHRAARLLERRGPQVRRRDDHRRDRLAALAERHRRRAARSTSRLQAEQQYSNAVSAQIDAMLASTLGPNKAFARVHADLDLDQQTIESVTYGKQGTKLTDTDRRRDARRQGRHRADARAAGTTATSASPARPRRPAATSKYSHKKGDTTFGVDKTVESKVVVPGAVQRLSIALVVDKSVPAAAGRVAPGRRRRRSPASTRSAATRSASRASPFGKQATVAAGQARPARRRRRPARRRQVGAARPRRAALPLLRPPRPQAPRGRGARRSSRRGCARSTESRPLAELEAGRGDINLSTEAPPPARGRAGRGDRPPPARDRGQPGHAVDA